MKKSGSSTRPAAPEVFADDLEKTGEYPPGMVQKILSSIPPEGEGCAETVTIPPPPELPGEAGEITVEPDPFPAFKPADWLRGDVVITEDDGEY